LQIIDRKIAFFGSGRVNKERFFTDPHLFPVYSAPALRTLSEKHPFWHVPYVDKSLAVLGLREYHLFDFLPAAIFPQNKIDSPVKWL
jgi:hypothetical protein